MIIQFLLHVNIPTLFILISISVSRSESNEKIYYRPQFQCRVPPLYTQPINPDNNFIVFGSRNDHSSGIGNWIKYYSDIFYFAIFSGRDILIDQNSVLGDFCTYVQCGFPFITKELAQNTSRRQIEHLDQIDKHMKGEILLTEKLLFPKHVSDNFDWWHNYEVDRDLTNCLLSLNGCGYTDPFCHISYAIQHIITGPIFPSPHFDRLVGAKEDIKHVLMHRRSSVVTPHGWNRHHIVHPLFDIGIHIRNSFPGFENELRINQSEYNIEVSNWLDSETSCKVFAGVWRKVKTIAAFRRVEEWNTKHSETTNEVNFNNVLTVQVYLAADNVRVKKALLDYLLASYATLQHPGFHLNFVYQSNPDVIRHAVFTQSFDLENKYDFDSTRSNSTDLFDFAIDWYALAMSSNILRSVPFNVVVALSVERELNSGIF